MNYIFENENHDNNELQEVSKLTFGSGGKAWINIDSDGYLHTNVGFYSDKFISARGTDSESGSGGASLPVVWASLTCSSSDQYANTKISNQHLSLSTSDISGLSAALSTLEGKIPSVGNGTITISQSGKTAQTFSVNQSGNTIITLNDTNTWRSITDSYNVDSPSSSVSLSQLGAKNLYSTIISKLTGYLPWGGSEANTTAMGWGTLTAANGYTILSHASSSDGGDMGFCYKSTQISMQLDGFYYQNEGNYRVLDTSLSIIDIKDFSTYVYSATLSRTANTFLAAPNGSAGVASFRKIAVADLSFLYKGTSVTSTNFNSDSSNSLIPTMGLLSYWNGAYNANGNSNLAYCCKGAFGDIITKSSTDYAVAGHTHTYIVAEDKRNNYPGQIAGPFSMKLSFLSKETLGISEGYWYDALIVRSYGDSTGGNDNALLFSKHTGSLYHTTYTFGSTSSWGSPRLILDLVNYSSYALPLSGGSLTGLLSICSSNTGNYNEGIRLHAASNGWATFTFCGASNTGATGTDSTSWFIGINSGTLRIGNDDWSTSSNLLTWTNGGALDIKSSSYFKYNGNTVWHAGNSNLNSVDWTCNTLYSGDIYIKNGTSLLWFSRSAVGFYIESNSSYLTFALHNASNVYTSWIFKLVNGGAVQVNQSMSINQSLSVTSTIYSATGIYSAGYVSARGQDTSSDIALKTDFSPICNALDYVNNTHYTKFKWKDTKEESIGIIAQEEEEREYGFLVKNHGDVGHLTYDYAASTALLGAAIQEEDSKVEKLKSRIQELENEIKKLKNDFR